MSSSFCIASNSRATTNGSDSLEGCENAGKRNHKLSGVLRLEPWTSILDEIRSSSPMGVTLGGWMIMVQYRVSCCYMMDAREQLSLPGPPLVESADLRSWLIFEDEHLLVFDLSLIHISEPTRL